jgi:cytochrome c-type biogenesis protein CcmH/NrfF
MLQTTLDDTIRKTITDEVKKGKTKIEVANQLGYTYYMVKKCAQDIVTPLTIPDELRQQIRDEYNKGKTKRQVAEELCVSRDTVIKYTKDLPKQPNRYRKRPEEEVARIREYVLKYHSKTEAARKLGLTMSIVRWYTQDILLTCRVSADVKEKIRNEVNMGKTEAQVAKEMDLPVAIVSKISAAEYGHKGKKRADISLREFLLLQELMDKGYAFSCKRYGLKQYQMLKEKFPSICRVKMHGRVIFFLEDKEAIAARAFLGDMRRKIISYKELKRVMNLFHTNLPQQEKQAFLLKNRARKLFGNRGVQKERALREKGDSFSFFYIRRYCINQLVFPDEKTMTP